ncbi:penicillin acylase family protein [Oceanimonas sp. NS1]|nr:penicillin acylase family protein [Oceanimonas sp. NS1]
MSNWNNRPAEGFPNPDQWWYSWNTIDRVLEINSRVDAVDRLTPEQAWGLMMEASLSDPNARFFLPRLAELAGNSAQPQLRQAARLLAGWDYLNKDEDRDGRYDHAAAGLFREWLSEMLQETYQPLLPDAHLSWYTATGHGNADGVVANGYNISTGTKALGAWLNRTVINTDLLSGRDGEQLQLSALGRAIDNLSQRYGPDMQDWLTPVDVLEFTHKNYIGVPRPTRRKPCVPPSP